MQINHWYAHKFIPFCYFYATKIQKNGGTKGVSILQDRRSPKGVWESFPKGFDQWREIEATELDACILEAIADKLAQ